MRLKNHLLNRCCFDTNERQIPGVIKINHNIKLTTSFSAFKACMGCSFGTSTSYSYKNQKEKQATKNKRHHDKNQYHMKLNIWEFYTLFISKMAIAIANEHLSLRIIEKKLNPFFCIVIEMWVLWFFVLFGMDHNPLDILLQLAHKRHKGNRALNILLNLPLLKGFVIEKVFCAGGFNDGWSQCVHVWMKTCISKKDRD